jgi:hypothetical protein
MSPMVTNGDNGTIGANEANDDPFATIKIGIVVTIVAIETFTRGTQNFCGKINETSDIISLRKSTVRTLIEGCYTKFKRVL